MQQSNISVWTPMCQTSIFFFCYHWYGTFFFYFMFLSPKEFLSLFLFACLWFCNTNFLVSFYCSRLCYLVHLLYVSPLTDSSLSCYRALEASFILVTISKSCLFSSVFCITMINLLASCYLCSCISWMGLRAHCWVCSCILYYQLQVYCHHVICKICGPCF